MTCLTIDTPSSKVGTQVTDCRDAPLTLAARFPGLKSLVVDIEFFDSASANRHAHMRYKPNLLVATSVFFSKNLRFDVADQLEKAAAARLSVITGEVDASSDSLFYPGLGRLGFVRFKLSLEFRQPPLSSQDHQPVDN